MISYNEAISIIGKYSEKINLSASTINLLDSLNFTLAEDIYSDINLPPFDSSSMDGYGIKFKNKVNEWIIIGEVSAGNYTNIILKDHEAVSIMTGAKLPPGVDTIIPSENIKIDDNQIKLKKNSLIKKGDYIRYHGEDLKTNKLAIPKGTIIKPKNVSLAAACGKQRVQVYSPLKIGVLSSGDELVSIDTIPQNDEIRCTNLYTLISLIKEINMYHVNFGFIKDDKKIIKKNLNDIFKSDLDILITTGAVSVGKYDYLKSALEETGCETIFWKVNIKPGKPLLFSIFYRKDKNILIFGLPGNPASCFVGFQLFIKPFIKKLYKNYINSSFKAVLENDVIKEDGRKHFNRGFYYFDENKNQFYVKGLGQQSSGNMFNLNNSNCLFILEESCTGGNAGDIVECIKI